MVDNAGEARQKRIGGSGSGTRRVAGRMPRLARQPAGKPQRIQTGGEVAGDRRARSIAQFGVQGFWAMIAATREEPKVC